MLHRYGVGHTFNSWTRMPPVVEQLALPDSVTTDFIVARFLLTPGRTYEHAKSTFHPYKDTQALDPVAREAGKAVIGKDKGFNSWTAAPTFTARFSRTAGFRAGGGFAISRTHRIRCIARLSRNSAKGDLPAHVHPPAQHPGDGMHDFFPDFLLHDIAPRAYMRGALSI